MKTFVLAALLLAVISAPAAADIIFLKDGRLLHVKILSGDEEGIAVELLDTGGKIFVRWELLRPDDGKRLRIELGLEDDDSGADLLMEGHRLFPRRGDHYDGLIESQDQTTVTLRHEGKELTFLREAVRRIEERTVNVFDVYTEEELYEQRLAEINPTDEDIPGHFELAKWATKIGMYAKALEHYTKITEEDPAYQAEYIANQIKRLEVLDKNKALVTAIKEAEREGRRHNYKECMGYFDVILENKDLTRDLKAEVEKKKARFEKRRWEYFSTLVVRDYNRFVKRTITTMARSKDITHRDKEKRLTVDKAMSYLRSKLHKEAVEYLAKKYELDPKKEVEKMWEERDYKNKFTASYGSGTFIVEGRAAGRRGDRANRRGEALRERLRRARGGRGQQNQSQPQQPQQKPVTKDEWWRRADSSQRAFWMRAFYAEKGGKMKVLNTSWRHCRSCGGTGSLKRLGTQGGLQRVPCPRCHEHKGDKIVTYR